MPDDSAADRSVEVGLCLTCRFQRATTTRRGSTFYRCARAETDPSFARYPQLPVRTCRGYEQTTPGLGATR